MRGRVKLARRSGVNFGRRLTGRTHDSTHSVAPFEIASGPFWGEGASTGFLFRLQKSNTRALILQALILDPARHHSAAQDRICTLIIIDPNKKFVSVAAGNVPMV